MRTPPVFRKYSAAMITAVLLQACGGGNGDSANSATVSGYVTDNLGAYDSVEFTINTVQLRHTGGRTCEIIRGPLAIDAAELGRDQIVEHVDTTTCESGPYNRLHVELGEDVTLRRTLNSQPITDRCKFVAYYDDNSSRPNRLACANGICSVDITGTTNLVAGSHEHVALDADLKEFTVDYAKTPCEVTLKVSPLHADDKLAAGYRVSLSGYVSDLDTEHDHFVLTGDGGAYTVLYAGVTDQSGLDDLLERVASDQLKTKVRCQTIDTSSTPPTCTSQSDPTRPLKAITVKAEGTVSALDISLQTFTLGYSGNSTLPVNYAKATELGKIEDTLADDVMAEVALYGFSLDNFLAREVKIQAASGS
jgi:hypothetical protein